MSAELFRDKLLLALMMLIIWLPVPLGSNRMLYWSLAEIWIGAMLMIWVIQYLRGRREVPTAVRRAWPALVILMLWLFYLALQMAPLPVAIVEFLSPQAAEIHRLAYHALDDSPWVTLSIEPYATLVGLHKSIAYVLLFLLVLLLVRRFRHVRWVAMAIVVSGALQAVLGVLDYLFHWSSLHWAEKGELSATFANRNHLANYLALSVAAGIGLLVAQAEGGAKRSFRENLRRFLDWIMSEKMRLRILLLLMTAALIMTRSRMGNAAFFVGLAVAGMVTLALARERNRGMVLLLVSLVVFDIFIMGSVVGLNRVVDRLEKTTLSADYRDEVARDTLTYWRDFQLTGSGLGTFGVLFPRYSGSDIRLNYRQAHNDYLQFAAETGVVGMLFIAGFVLLNLAVALRTLRQRRVSWSIGIAFALLMATAVLIMHSTVEFNLQIFANAALYMVLAALGWAVLFLPVHRRHRVQAGGIGGRSPLLAGMLALFVTVHLVFVARLATADALNNVNERLLKQWNTGVQVSPAVMRAALERQSWALELASASPRARLVAARLLSMEMRIFPMTESEKASLYHQILLLLLDATRKSPASANAWVAIAYVRHLQRHYDAVFKVGLLRASQLAPWRERVQHDLVKVGLSAWTALPDERIHAVVMETVRRGMKQFPSSMTALIKKLGYRQLVCRRFGDEPPQSLCGGERREETVSSG